MRSDAKRGHDCKDFMLLDLGPAIAYFAKALIYSELSLAVVYGTERETNRAGVGKEKDQP
jgi:hypothetical protein